MMSTDVDGVFYGCRAALPHLQETRGSIVNTASVSGTGGYWGMSPYNAARGAVVNLTRSLALDLGKKGIRVNAVYPTDAYGHDERHERRQEAAGEVRRADPVRPGPRTGGRRRCDRVPREHDRCQRSGARGRIRLPWTTAAR